MRLLAHAFATVALIGIFASPVHAQRFEEEFNLLAEERLPFSESDLKEIAANLTADIKGQLYRTDQFILEAQKNLRPMALYATKMRLLEQGRELIDSINRLINTMPALSSEGATISREKKKVDQTTRLLFAARKTIGEMRDELDKR